MKRARKTTRKIESPDDLEGYNELDHDHKEVLQQCMQGMISINDEMGFKRRLYYVYLYYYILFLLLLLYNIIGIARKLPNHQGCWTNHSISYQIN